MRSGRRGQDNAHRRHRPKRQSLLSIRHGALGGGQGRIGSRESQRCLVENHAIHRKFPST